MREQSACHRGDLLPQEAGCLCPDDLSEGGGGEGEGEGEGQGRGGRQGRREREKGKGREGRAGRGRGGHGGQASTYISSRHLIHVYKIYMYNNTHVVMYSKTNTSLHHGTEPKRAQNRSACTAKCVTPLNITTNTTFILAHPWHNHLQVVIVQPVVSRRHFVVSCQSRGITCTRR